MKESNEVYIAGIFDLTNSYDWGNDIFNFTVKLINKGWWDMADKNAQVVYKLMNSQCDPTTAVRVGGTCKVL